MSLSDAGVYSKEETSRNGLSGDCIYIAIVTDQIYVDLRAAPLAEPERVRVYFKELLVRASAADLAEANRRYAILTAYRAGGWNQELGVTMRTIQRWEADVRQSEAVYLCRATPPL